MIEAECPRPPADLLPAESAVEVFESFSAACFESELLKAQFVTSNVADTVHQRCADTAAAEVGMGLNAFDRAPVRNDSVPVSTQAQPSGEGTVELGEQEPAVLRIKACDELIRDWSQVSVSSGKRERMTELRAGTVITSSAPETAESRIATSTRPNPASCRFSPVRP